MTRPVKVRADYHSNLEEYVALWPTPQSQDAKHGAPTEWEKKHQVQAHLHNVVNGTLNPMWVEWLMGFPLGWTAFDASGTPSSRKSSR